MIINNNNNQKFDHFGSEIPKIFVVCLSLDAKNETISNQGHRTMMMIMIMVMAKIINSEYKEIFNICRCV